MSNYDTKIENIAIGVISNLVPIIAEYPKVRNYTIAQISNTPAGDIKHLQKKIEFQINATPTGNLRNILTEVNILLLNILNV